MFKLKAYSAGKLPPTLCLCRNSIRTIADATVCRALTRKHTAWFPQGGQGGALLCWPPALGASQQHLWARREVKAEAMCYSDKYVPTPAHGALSLSRESRLAFGGAEQLSSRLNDELRPCNRAVHYTEFCFSGCYIYDMEWFLKIQIANLFPNQLCFFSRGRGRRMK